MQERRNDKGKKGRGGGVSELSPLFFEDLVQGMGRERDESHRGGEHRTM